MLRILPLLLLLTACSGSAVVGGFGVNTFTALSADSVLELRQTLTIPADALVVYLQQGRVSSGGVNQYQPNCTFELRHKRAVSQQVQPDKFLIRQFGAQRSDTGALGFYIGGPGDLFGADAPSFTIATTVFYLHSPKQPDVLALRCQQWQPWGEARYLSRADIQNALGDVIYLP